MKSLTRYLLAVLVAVWLILPGISSEGGEEGTGIWVLPGARSLCYGAGGPCFSEPRETRSLPITADIVMRVSVDMGGPVATFVDEVSALPVSLSACGKLITIPSSLLIAVSHLSTPRANILITDAMQMGYLIHINFDVTTGRVSIQVD